MLLATLAACGWLAVAAGGDLLLDEPVRISVSGGNAATKAKIIRQHYSTAQGFETPLVVIYADGIGPDVRVHDGTTHAARDVFVSRSVDDGASWSMPTNLSETALRSSMMVDHDGDPLTPRRPFYGDSIKPMLFGSGRDVLVTWVDAFCPTPDQRSVIYELDDDHHGFEAPPEARVADPSVPRPEAGPDRVEVPYHAVYAARSTDGGMTWSAPERLTSGARDARQCAARGSGASWVIVWQADPRGLQPGEGLGCGPGGSGARVSPGTDIWLSALAADEFRSGAPFPEPRRVSDNFTRIDGDPGQGEYESGDAGASRPSVMLMGGTAAVAYEETKGRGSPGMGKFVRYHVFPALDDGSLDVTGGAGWIVSDPQQNGRRARLVPAGSPAGDTGLRFCILFRQGRGVHAADAAIAARVALGGTQPEHLYPMVSPAATNFKSALESAPPTVLSTMEDPARPVNAMAHRAIIIGDTIVAGFCQARQPARAGRTTLTGADFFVRRSQDGGVTWEPLHNLSRMATGSITVVEPRLIKTPGSPDPSEPRNLDVFYASWGTQVFDPTSDREEAPSLDLYLTRTGDRGTTYLEPVPLAGTPMAELESQVRCTPTGRRVFGVWQSDGADRSDIIFRSGRAIDACVVDLDGDGFVTPSDLALLCEGWGTDGEGDLDGDGQVGRLDLLLLLDGLESGREPEPARGEAR